jgi:hypothetical protein
MKYPLFFTISADSVPSVIILLLTLASLIFSGCETPKEKREREAEERREFLVNQRQESERQRQIAEARSDYQKALQAYQGIQGSYAGSYTVRNGSSEETVLVHIDATVAGAAATAAYDAANSESEVRAMESALSLHVTIAEIRQSTGNRIAYCSLPSIRPDFGSGTLRLTCALNNGGVSRYYDIYFERSEAFSSRVSASDIAITEQEIMARAQEVSSSLVAGRIRQVGGLNLRIQAPRLTFYGSLSRSR